MLDGKNIKKFLTISIITAILSFATLSSDKVFAISGACSYHSGANCGIGSVNNQAVCNDGWVSSVPYYDMEECIGYDSSCKSYLDGAQYFSTKNTLKNDLATKKDRIDKLKSDLNSLDYKEAQALIDLQESFKGRGATRAGIQVFINAINREYAFKKIEMSQQINTAMDEYNDIVKKYNGICQNYTSEQKNNVCVQNYGSEYKYSGGFCIAPPPTVTVPPPTIPACTSWAYSDWSKCVNNLQTRTIISMYPANCSGGSPIVFQLCQEELTSNNTDVINNKQEPQKEVVKGVSSTKTPVKKNVSPKTNMNARQTNSSKSKVLGVAKKGVSYEFILEKSGWIKIKFNGKEGWVSKSHVVIK